MSSPLSSEDTVSSASDSLEVTPISIVDESITIVDEAVEDPEICFGAICNVKVQILHAVDIEYKEDNERPPYVSMTLTCKDGAGVLVSPNGENVGMLNKRTMQLIEPATQLQSIRFEVFLRVDEWNIIKRQFSLQIIKTAMLSLEMNVYGRAAIADEVASRLANPEVFLQRPIFGIASHTYENPHSLKLPHFEDKEEDVHESRPIRVVTAVEETSDSTLFDIDNVFDGISGQGLLEETAVDQSIQTELLKHQKEASDFIMRRELGGLPPENSIWKSYESSSGQKMYQHIIVPTARSTEQQDCPGGILADDMGLGKSLSILSAIMASKTRAIDYTMSILGLDRNSTEGRYPCAATLIVVPSALLIDSWEEEIKRHLKPGSVKVYRYHGQEKQQIGLFALLQFDIVITTYATIASENTREQKMLFNIHWFRVVLDEAHQIRNASTKQFKAITSISSRNRWVLTGTPVQNSLDDLGTLIKYLKLPYLQDPSVFKNYITKPALSKIPDRYRNLRLLLTSVALRRTRKILPQLKNPLEQEIKLDFSTAESQKLHEIGIIARQEIDMAVSGRNTKRVHQCVLQALLRLRLFCNHGLTDDIPPEHSMGFPSDAEEALSLLQTMNRASCSLCTKDVTSIGMWDNPGSGVVTICQHAICNECLPTYTEKINRSHGWDDMQKCPICGRQGYNDFLLSTSIGGSGSLAMDPIWTANSTKMLEVARRLEQRIIVDKSVVFSFWKRTLNKIQTILVQKGIDYVRLDGTRQSFFQNLETAHFVRIDGSMPLKQRRETLSHFETNQNCKIILMTLGTGAVGLNSLAVANHIHITEPQWNPAVETQAIARILRLGQEKNVMVTRYLMNHSVEQNVKRRQFRKLQLAHGGFRLNKDEEPRKQVSRIMDLLNLSEEAEADQTLAGQ